MDGEGRRSPVTPAGWLVMDPGSRDARQDPPFPINVETPP